MQGSLIRNTPSDYGMIANMRYVEAVEPVFPSGIKMAKDPNMVDRRLMDHFDHGNKIMLAAKGKKDRMPNKGCPRRASWCGSHLKR